MTSTTTATRAATAGSREAQPSRHHGRAVARPAGRHGRGSGPRYATRGRSSAAIRRRRSAAVAALVAVTVGGLALRSDAAPATAPAPVTVVVAPGDTVWDLALAHLPPGSSPHAYVAEVLARNDVDAAAVRPGTVLRLPRG